MLRWLISKKLGSEEKKLGASLDYARFILRVSLRAFIAFARVLHLAEYRRAAPPDVLTVAGLVSTKRQDCGACVQIAINQAKAAGVDAAILRATLDDAPDALPEGLADVYRFACAVVQGDVASAHDLRATMRERYGDAALIEVSYALAMGAFFPTIKRTLGFDTSCATNPPVV